MTSIIKVDTIQDQDGNNIINENADTITIGASGDTITIPAGATFDASSATVTIPAVNLTTGVTGTLPVANGGTNLTSGFANGITEADQWRLTANITASVDPIASNLERSDSTGFGYIGTGMTVASGTWTFPSTGIYFVQFTLLGSGTNDTVGGEIKVTTNNSTYTVVAQGVFGDNGANTNTATTSTYVDVTDVANVKVRFTANSISVGTVMEGSSTQNLTHFTFIRLGDT